MKVDKSQTAIRRWHPGQPIIPLLTAVMLVSAGSGLAQTAGDEGENIKTPSYYPSDYQEIIEAAKQEGGELVIHSSASQERWDPIFAIFQKQYPFISDVKNLDLEGEEVYQRLRAQASRGVPGADVVEIQPSVGARLRHHASLLLEYESPEAGQYPEDLIQPFPKGYQFAIAAIIIGYNTKVLPHDVATIEDVAEQLSSSGDTNLTVGVRDINSQFALTTYYYLLSAKPDLWDDFKVILKYSKPEGSSGSLLTKLETGEYAAAIFISDSAILPAVKRSGGLLAATLPKDGTPFQGAAVAISASSPHPNTAKLFVDFMLSEKGQQAILEGGRPAIRSGLEPIEGLYSFEQATDAIPKDAVVIVPYKQIPPEEAKEFKERWNQLRNAAQ